MHLDRPHAAGEEARRLAGGRLQEARRVADLGREVLVWPQGRRHGVRRRPRAGPTGAESGSWIVTTRQGEVTIHDPDPVTRPAGEWARRQGAGFLAVVDVQPIMRPSEKLVFRGRTWLQEKLYERN